MAVKPAVTPASLVLFAIVVLFAIEGAAAPKPQGQTASRAVAETVVIPSGGSLQKLVIVEAGRQQRANLFRRMTSFVPIVSSSVPLSLIIARKGLTEAAQVHSEAASFVTALGNFSAPRLAVYDDANPCIDSSAGKGEEKSPGVVGVPYPQTDASAKVEFVMLTDKSLAKNSRGLSVADIKLLKKLLSEGYGLLRVSYKPSPMGKGKSASPPLLLPALQIAIDGPGSKTSVEIHGNASFLVERFFLGASTIESVEAGAAQTFPTGVELPTEAAAILPQIHNEWLAKTVGTGMVKRFAGPATRCDVCYELPLAAATLQAAGVFWGMNPAGNKAAATQGTTTGEDTWLTRHLWRKAPKAVLSITMQPEPASVGSRFVEQASVQQPFHGEIFCPAMEGYQKSVAERREKAVAALSELTGWNEKKLSEIYTQSGGKKRAWYQDHWQSSK